MLGIRHVHGVAFDLYQGAITGFACDAYCTSLFSIKEARGLFGTQHTAYFKCAGSSCESSELNLALQKQPLAQGSVIVTAPGFLPSKKASFLHTITTSFIA
jgi:hypothetical protein